MEKLGIDNGVYNQDIIELSTLLFNQELVKNVFIIQKLKNYNF